MVPDLTGLPEGDLVRRGLEEAQRRVISEASLLVWVGASALQRLGLHVPPRPHEVSDPNRALYRLLCDAKNADPYRRYNALIRGLVSFTRALEARCSRSAG